ncbi:lysophospholipid acyltransferase family protein [Brevundimonas sp.]|uniref:lysophospholipid acyltransferase family protein n=1 Tax=Brevundimonas sp. TaxID=1871086 RepID=UPI001A33323E|nr:lysophospholipid acyltransferase family protein [Brevundimonas sp.]MBJ7486345.1 lysophospholipid acyltransferase family protein [Brevundimonas sp.]
MRPLRNPIIQSVLAHILAGWMQFCFATIRWTHENDALAEAVWADGGGVICAYWHSRIALSPACWPLGRAQPVKGLVSLSPDGQFIATAMALQGIPAVRGSSANKDKADRAKGGTQALRDGLKQLKVAALAVTPDGPRGPARQMAEGLPLMAKLSGAPVLFIGLSCNPAIRLNSWDRAVLPLPFGKGSIVWDVDRFPAGADLSEVAAAWSDRLTAVEARADAVTGLKRV